MEVYNFDYKYGPASFYGMREGIDIYSFDLKMVVFRSMVRDKVWFLTFLTEGMLRCMQG